MHEAMEQQCYHPDLELTFADNSKQRIGYFVDNLIEQNKDKVRQGVDCEVLSLNQEFKILTTDFEGIYPIKISKVSRHKSPKRLIKIKLTNGKEIVVTPEHPCWTFNREITTIPAERLKEGDFFPIPSELPILGDEQSFEVEPYKNGPALCKVLGYHITDGCYELNRGKKNGIQFGNNDRKLIEDYSDAIKSFFNKSPSITKRGNQYSVRVISKDIVEFMHKLDKNLMEKGIRKVIPDQIMKCKKEDLVFLLRALFDGDGTVVNVKRNGCRVTLVADNKRLADQVSELLLRFGILSSIYKDGSVFRVDTTGSENLAKFYNYIGFVSEKKSNRLKEYLQKNKP